MRHIGMGPALPRFLTPLLLAASLASIAGAESIKVPTGELRNSTLADLKPHPSGSNTYNELWTYHLFLDGNIQAYLNFSRVNLGAFKSPVCGADLTVLGLKGRNWSVAREYEKSNFQFIDSSSRLEVHKNIWFEGKLPDRHRLYFSSRKKEVDYLVDLEFSETVPGKVWGDGMFKVGSQTVGIFMHIPRAKVKGRIAINKDTLQVTGMAYMDHTFQTDLAPALVGAGYRFIAQDGSLEVGYFLDPLSRYGRTPIGYGLRFREGAAALLKPTSMAVHSAGRAMGVKVATRLEITFQDGTKAVLDRKQDRFQQSYLHEFSGLTKMAIKRYMGGEVLGFKGMGTLNATQPMAYNYFVVD